MTAQVKWFATIEQYDAHIDQIYADTSDSADGLVVVCSGRRGGAGEMLPTRGRAFMLHACPGKAGPIRTTPGEACQYCKAVAPKI